MAKKAMSPASPPDDSGQDKQALISKLLKIEGMNQELAEQIVKHGVPDDSYTVQAFYRVSAITADAAIKVFEEAK